MLQTYLWSLTFLGVIMVSTSSPEPHHNHDPVLAFLKQLKKARKATLVGGSGILGNREEDSGSGSSEAYPQGQGQGQGGFQFQNPGSIISQVSQGQRPTQSQSQPTVPILFPSGGSGSGISSSGSRPNDQRLTVQQIQQIANLPTIPPRPITSPQDIQRINSGVSTILNGVASFDLGQILRGAFIFPRDENVKSVANNVIDTIFGTLSGGGGSASGAQDAKVPPTRN